MLPVKCSVKHRMRPEIVYLGIIHVILHNLLFVEPASIPIVKALRKIPMV